MMEGENVKASPQSFNPPQPKAARPLPILHRVLVLPKKSFNEFIQQQVQALIFLLLFWSSKKVKALRRLAEASQSSGERFQQVMTPADRWMLQKKISFTLQVKIFYLVLAGRAFFLLTAKETKLPARNFFIQVSSWAGSVPSQKIDHAGLRAERRNGGLALLGSNSDRHSYYKSKSASNFLLMLWPPCYPA